MKIYLAAPYSQKDEIKAYAEELRAGGVIVTSSWLEEPHKPTTQMNDLTHEQHQQYAIADVKDVVAAQILVFFTDKTKSIIRAGRHVEFGMFIGMRAVTKKGLPIFVVGDEYENIFHHLPQVNHFKKWEEVRDLLIAMTEAEQPTPICNKGVCGV